jgi:hypothetical protein
MPSGFSDLLRITDKATPSDQRIVAMRDFAQELQWQPSYEVQGTLGVDAAGGHLVVEHGLENTAAISFLTAPYRAADLDSSQLRSLLSISYNNLIEWHVFLSSTDVRWINNLADKREPEADQLHLLSASNFSDYVSASRLDEIERREEVRRSFKACDEALLQVIARWKRLLTADYPGVRNRNISALFNALILVRGCEDRDLNCAPGSSRNLLQALNADQAAVVDLPRVITNALGRTGIDVPLDDFISPDAIAPFRAMDRATVENLLRELYTPRDAAYDFNFALMSKHALSKIYEKYVSLLRDDDQATNPQLSFIVSAPVEVSTPKYGSVYTPQFIAGFFARFIRENTTPRRFRDLCFIDPACGSGIFVRTLLELQCDPLLSGTTTATIQKSFSSAEAVDKDPNACEATRLSLALLYLIATGSFPRAANLHVRNEDAILAALQNRLHKQAYGAVLTNPPYVKLDHLSPEDRETYRAYLATEDVGRLDAYIAFVRLCLDLVEPNGFVCLVLPQVFLTASNAGPLRKEISTKCNIRCLVDLSAIPVFQGVGTYTILLIIQRKPEGDLLQGPPAMVAQVTEGVGPALQACLDASPVDTPYCSVFPLGQHSFQGRHWVLVSPDQAKINDHLEELPRLSKFMAVKQGFLTGADDVFIIPKTQIPRGEQEIYVDYLPDRQITRYRTPARADRAVFFPYRGTEQISEDDLARSYPETWQYLLAKRTELESRKSVRFGRVPWWRPVRPREPATLLRPKIVCPHLMLTPRFAIDKTGKFAVSHSPFVIANDQGDDSVLLRFFCGVLNSSVCNWYLRTYAPKYGRGYNRLEVALLKTVPVPDFARISAGDLSSVVRLVDQLTLEENENLDRELDDLIARLYGFTPGERRELLRIG